MPIIEGTTRLKTAVAEYDFAIDGGAVGSIPLRGIDIHGGSVPAGATVYSGYVEVVTPLTSGGAATAGLTLESAGDLVGNGTLISAAPWSSGGRKNLTPAWTAAGTIKTTATRGPTLTVGVAPLTAGKIRVVKFYV
jgi:hypothetical protein